MTERAHCSCHDISRTEFSEACERGAHNVKACFKQLGCLPKCANCIPLVRQVLNEHQQEAPNK